LVFSDECVASIFVDQFFDDRDAGRSIADMYDRLIVLGSDLHRRVFAAGGGSTDEQGLRHPSSFHLASDDHHFIQRGGDQSGKPDDLGSLGFGFVENGFAGLHHAEINDVETVAAQHHTDDVFADIVDVPFDGRD